MSNESEFHEPHVTINRVYTRHGDHGETRLVGGQEVPKDDARIEAYGTVDELNAHVGGAAVACGELGLTDLAEALLRVQHALFNLGSLLATLPEDLHPQQPRVRQADIDWLEADMDRRNATLPTLRSFVLPGGHRANVDLHLCRTVCRRAERLCVTLARTQGVDPMCVPYLNRLSDAFFVWSRFALHATGRLEVLWRPNEA
jgi:cob(I)alamin adenosyltransferase